MNEKEFCDYEKDEKNRNPKSQKRANEVTDAVTKRMEKTASSSSAHKESKSATENTKGAEEEKEEISTTSDAESPTEFSEDLRKKCLEELLLPINELNSTMLSLWLEIGELSATHTCDSNFLGISATISAEIPRAVTPLRIEEKYTDKKPSAFVLT